MYTYSDINVGWRSKMSIEIYINDKMTVFHKRAYFVFFQAFNCSV